MKKLLFPSAALFALLAIASPASSEQSELACNDKFCSQGTCFLQENGPHTYCEPATSSTSCVWGPCKPD